MFNFRTVYGHVGGRVWSPGRVQCSIMDASLESFSHVLVECHRYYEQGNTWHACVGTARGQQYPQLPKNLSTSHRNRPSTVTGFVVEAKTYLRVNDPVMCSCVSARANKNNSKHGCSGAQATVVLNQTQNGGNQHAICLWGRNADTAD